LLTTDQNQEAFHQLSMAKKKIVEKLQRNDCLRVIDDEAHAKDLSVKNVSVPELYLLEVRHFVYKQKKISQILCSDITIPYESSGRYTNYMEGIIVF
jgi:hypothetical protein